MKDFDLEKIILQKLNEIENQKVIECNTEGYICSEERAKELLAYVKSRGSRGIAGKVEELEWEYAQMQVEAEQFYFSQGVRWCLSMIKKISIEDNK